MDINLMPLCARSVFSSRHSGNLFALLMFATFEFVQATGASSAAICLQL